MTTESLQPEQRPQAHPEPPREIGWAIAAAHDKKASDVTLLHLVELGAFTDYFLLCSGASTRQVQAISEAIEEQLERRGLPALHREGYENAEWVLLDYGGFIVHIFSERARSYYDLERLWRRARQTNFPPPRPSGASGK